MVGITTTFWIEDPESEQLELCRARLFKRPVDVSWDALELPARTEEEVAVVVFVVVIPVEVEVVVVFSRSVLVEEDIEQEFVVQLSLFSLSSFTPASLAGVGAFAGAAFGFSFDFDFALCFVLAFAIVDIDVGVPGSGGNGGTVPSSFPFLYPLFPG